MALFHFHGHMWPPITSLLSPSSNTEGKKLSFNRANENPRPDSHWLKMDLCPYLNQSLVRAWNARIGQVWVTCPKFGTRGQSHSARVWSVKNRVGTMSPRRVAIIKTVQTDAGNTPFSSPKEASIYFSRTLSWTDYLFYPQLDAIFIIQIPNTFFDFLTHFLLQL